MKTNAKHAEGKQTETFSWRISKISAKLVFLGNVEAPDQETAIQKAIEEFKIDPAHHQKLVAERRG